MEGKLIIEVYEFSENVSETPVFEYIPCDLSSCLKRNQQTALKEIIQKGFDALPRAAQNTEKHREILQKIEDAGIARINAVYQESKAERAPMWN